jgi:RNA polymerase sigma-70 factor, ECF subfamily
MEQLVAREYHRTQRTEPSWASLVTMTEVDITGLLVAWGRGDEDAFHRLVPLVHAELQRLAGSMMQGERAGHTLQPTALVNELYLRLVDVRRVRWQDRNHFLSMTSRLMRRVLVDHARTRRSKKRGGGAVRITLADDFDLSHEPGRDLVALDDALTALAATDERKGRVIELRFFGGLSVEETAAVLGISVETVMRDAKLARAWLQRELRAGTTRHD